MRRPSAPTERALARLAAAATGGLLVAVAATFAAGTACAGDDALRAALRPLGPWPQAAPPPGDAASAAAVALGEQLFFSPRLGSGGVRCASCHEPWRGFVDGRPRALGVGQGTRNTPTLLDVARHRRFGWDGGRDDLAEQSLRPLADANEMPAPAAQVGALLRGDATLAARYAAAFGSAPPADDDAAVRGAGRALAAYVATLASPRTPFDAWRDAVVAGGFARAPSPAAERGFALFAGRGGCVACHAGPAFSDDAPHASVSRPQDAFRTPGLRGVAATAPYMHDGSVASLCDAVRPHALGQPAGLDAGERHDLAAFLATLQPGPTPDTPACGPD